MVIEDTTIPDAQLGRADEVVTASGRRIPIRYAVVDAARLLPSHRADGTPNKGYEQGQSLVLRVVAGNGRTAGLQEAYRRGTTAAYVEGIANDQFYIFPHPKIRKDIQTRMEDILALRNPTRTA